MKASECWSPSRRALLQGGGIGLLAMTVSGPAALMAARNARAEGHSLAVLKTLEGRLLESLGEVLLPGAAQAGLAHFVDQQLASPEPLLLLRYLDFPMDHAEFYREGLAALDGLASARHARGFAELASPEQVALVTEISRGNPTGWQGPPAPLFFFVTRSDAVDVVYGTQDGFARLDLPYNAHIVPPSNW